MPERALQGTRAHETVAHGASGTKDTAIKDAAKQFEGVFMSMLVNEMFKGTDITGSSSPYAGLVTQQLGDAMANAGGIGLASMITRQMEGTR